MRIADSNIRMDANWSSFHQRTTTENMQYWNDNNAQKTNTLDALRVDISKEGRVLAQSMLTDEVSQAVNEEPSDLLSEKEKEKIKLLEDFIYVVSGKRIKFVISAEKLEELKHPSQKIEPLPMARPGNGIQSPVRQGWGLRYDFHETIYEQEKMSFQSAGTVTTTDGRRIDFNLNLSVSREFISEESLSIRAGDALIDPLVINFKNASAALGARDFAFDIDSDGDAESISFTAQGSGFLALDLNGNQSIDDGSELFGPSSGNGFGELSGYDSDKNGWIDENDPIYEKLKIWSLDESGNKTLFALGQVGVGAIYLGSVESKLGLKTASNESLGQIARTGVYLNENGTVGTIQHVDLSV